MTAPFASLPWCVAALCAGLTSVAAQAPPLVTDRPDFTESAHVIPPGLAQVEAGYTVVRADGTTSHAFGELMLRLPVFARVEARLALNSILVEDAADSRARYEGLGLGFKAKVFSAGGGSARWRPDVAVLGGALLPLNGTGDRETVISGRVAAGWEVTTRLGLGANLGLLSGSEDGNRFRQAVTSISVGFAAGEQTGLYVEYFGLHPEAASGADRPFLNVGVPQRFGAGWQLDARVGGALTGSSAVFGGVGVSVRW